MKDENFIIKNKELALHFSLCNKEFVDEISKRINLSRYKGIELAFTSVPNFTYKCNPYTFEPLLSILDVLLLCKKEKHELFIDPTFLQNAIKSLKIYELRNTIYEKLFTC